jgi:peptide/nickel transport system substrate-binding protein
LDAAGWRDEDGDGTRSRENQPLQIHIVAPSWGSNSEVAQLLRAAWETVGASVELEVAPGFGPLNEMQAAGEYHLIGINLFDSDPDLLRSFYASDGFYNWTGYADSELDALLTQAAEAALDPELRWELYAAAATRIRDQALLIPIRDYVNLVVTNNRIQGLHFSAQGWFPLLIDLKMTP